VSKKRKDNSHPEGSIDEHLDMNELSEIVLVTGKFSKKYPHYQFI